MRLEGVGARVDEKLLDRKPEVLAAAEDAERLVGGDGELDEPVEVGEGVPVVRDELLVVGLQRDERFDQAREHPVAVVAAAGEDGERRRACPAALGGAVPQLEHCLLRLVALDVQRVLRHIRLVQAVEQVEGALPRRRLRRRRHVGVTRAPRADAVERREAADVVGAELVTGGADALDPGACLVVARHVDGAREQQQQLSVHFRDELRSHLHRRPLELDRLARRLRPRLRHRIRDHVGVAVIGDGDAGSRHLRGHVGGLEGELLLLDLGGLGLGVGGLGGELGLEHLECHVLDGGAAAVGEGAHQPVGQPHLRVGEHPLADARDVGEGGEQRSAMIVQFL